MPLLFIFFYFYYSGFRNNSLQGRFRALSFIFIGLWVACSSGPLDKIMERAFLSKKVLDSAEVGLVWRGSFFGRTWERPEGLPAFLCFGEGELTPSS